MPMIPEENSKSKPVQSFIDGSINHSQTHWSRV